MGIREVGVLIIAVAGAYALGGPVSGAGPRVTLLHTNDIHGHVFGWTGWEGALKGQRVGGFDRLGTAIHSVRSEVGKDRTLLLDAGDTLGDTALADLSAG